MAFDLRARPWRRSRSTGIGDDYSILIGETLAAVAFGLSWLAKGAELDVLLGSRARRPGRT